jgi:squalene-hopene/tetraprenyl-beta-curcumene cyclase
MALRKSALALAVMAAVAATPVLAAIEGQTQTEQKAITYLLAQQDKDGAWMPQAGPGVTALILKGLLRAGYTPDDEHVKKALEFIEKSHQSDGGWYTDSHATYNTAITLSALASLPEPAKAKYKDEITKAQDFLKSIQSGASNAPTDDKGNPVTKDHPWFGGWGYGEGSNMKPGRRPDLSNSHFVIEALRESGVPADDPTIKNALVFLTRTQASEANDSPWAKGRNDGGFIYSMRWNPKHNYYGESEAGDTKDREGNEVLTAYGSMTYAGLKSLLYADVKKDDPRVKAAMRWITNNYSLDVNPGLNTKEGLFYYYHVYATALRAYGEDTITDSKGVKHEWRKEFDDAMAAQQKPDGSFVNTADRWMEKNPVLATSYVLLALQDARLK